MSKVIQKKKRVRYKVKNILICLFSFIFIIGAIIYTANHRITNIYIEGNKMLSDQDIIDMAGLHDYPKLYKISHERIKKKLNKSIYISNVSISRHNFFREITIHIDENIPLVYYAYNDEYLLKDGTATKENFDVPTIINQVPESILTKLLRELSKLDSDVLYRISEIRYVDEDLFFLTMTDGNGVNINIKNFNKLNDYLDILRRLDKSKGILNLDRGDYLTKYKD